MTGSVPFFPAPLLSGLAATLADLLVDDITINRILSTLSTGQDDIQQSPFDPTPDDAFGDLDGGVEMAYHTGQAHQFMAESMLDMMKTLGYYAEGVEIFRQKVKNADEVSATDLNRYHRAVQNAEGANRRQPGKYDPVGGGDN